MHTALSDLRGSRSTPLLAGDNGVGQTIGIIRRLVDDALKSPRIKDTALWILQSSGAPQYDQWAAAQVVYDWVHRNIYYVQDPVGKETVRPAEVILAVRGGDCDDINGILLPALLGSIGITTRLVTVAADAMQPDQFSHVYAEALLDGVWVPLDAARPGASFGQAPEIYYRRKEWPLFDTAPGMKGLGGIGFDASDIAQLEQGTAQIIQAATGHYSPYPVITTASGGVINPYGTNFQASASSPINGTTILLGLAALFLIMRR